MKNMLGISIPENSGFVWSVFNDRKPVIMNDVNNDERFYNGIDLDTGFRTRNIICIPMMARGEFLGVLQIVNKKDPGIFSRFDLKLIEIIAMISASSITNRLLYEDLKKRVEELNALNELTKSIAMVDNELLFFKNVITTIADSLNVERGSLILFIPERGRLEIVATYGSSIPVGSVVPDDSIAAHVFRTGKLVNVSNIKKDLPEYCKKHSGYKSNAFVSVPLYYENKISGVLNLTDKKNRRLFDDFELNVLSSITSHIAAAYKNFLERRTEEKRRRLRQELKIASDIQRKNLVKIPSQFNGINVSLMYEPAKQVGGDFFDFYKFDGAACGIIIADVSGKGIPAALFTGTVKNILKIGSKVDRRPSALFRSSNGLICEESEYGMFVTVFYVLIDTESCRITYSSAGHDSQLLISRRKLEAVKLQAPGKPLGIIDPAEFYESTTAYERGDILCLFTDGVIESLGGESMDTVEGTSALAKIVIDNIESPPEVILNIIRNTIRDRCFDSGVLDDLTMLIVQL